MSPFNGRSDEPLWEIQQIPPCARARRWRPRLLGGWAEEEASSSSGESRPPRLPGLGGESFLNGGGGGKLSPMLMLVQAGARGGMRTSTTVRGASAPHPIRAGQCFGRGGLGGIHKRSVNGVVHGRPKQLELRICSTMHARLASPHREANFDPCSSHMALGKCQLHAPLARYRLQCSRRWWA